MSAYENTTPYGTSRPRLHDFLHRLRVRREEKLLPGRRIGRLLHQAHGLLSRHLSRRGEMPDEMLRHRS